MGGTGSQNPSPRRLLAQAAWQLFKQCAQPGTHILRIMKAPPGLQYYMGQGTGPHLNLPSRETSMPVQEVSPSPMEPWQSPMLSRPPSTSTG